MTAKRSTPASKRTTKKTAAEPDAAKSRRARPPKVSRAKPVGGAAYSTSALTAAFSDQEFEDFSALIDRVADVTDEDSSEDVARALAKFTLASPKRLRHV
jgi:hypothetical protein